MKRIDWARLEGYLLTAATPCNLALMVLLYLGSVAALTASDAALADAAGLPTGSVTTGCVR